MGGGMSAPEPTGGMGGAPMPAPGRDQGPTPAQPPGNGSPTEDPAGVQPVGDDPSEEEPNGDGEPEPGTADPGPVEEMLDEEELCDVGVYDGVKPTPLPLSGATFAHDPTMIEVNGTFYRFWTGRDIPVATSTDLRSWRNARPVFTSGYPDWVGPWLDDVPRQTFNFPWAPDVSAFGGQVHLYSSFSARFGANISCITHLTTDDPGSGDWTDHGPVICTDGSERYNAIDADVALDRDGTPWFAFGSFWDGIMAFELDQRGDRVGTDLTRLAWAREIEAPVLFYRCGYYYLFVTWGICCPGENRRVQDLTYRVAVGRSEDILGPYIDRDGRPMLEGGGTIVVQGDATFAAAGHSDVIVSGDKIYHFYHAYRRPTGAAELRIVEMPFDDEGWPVPAGP